MLNPIDKLFWLRIILGVATGVLLSILSLSGELTIILVIAIYFISYLIGRYFLNISSGTGHKLFSTGISSYILLFLFTWILLNTISINI